MTKPKPKPCAPPDAATLRALHRIELMEPGDAFEYWHGPHLGDCPETLIQAVRKLYDEGLVELIQRKHGPYKFSYIIRRRTWRDTREPTFISERAKRHLGSSAATSSSPASCTAGS